MKLHKTSGILDGSMNTLLSAVCQCSAAHVKLHQNNPTYYSVCESLRVKFEIVYVKTQIFARTDRHGFCLRLNMSTV